MIRRPPRSTLFPSRRSSDLPSGASLATARQRGSGQRGEPGARLGSDDRASTLVEPDERHRAGQLRVLELENVEDTKRLYRIREMSEHTPISVVDEEKTFHVACVPFTLAIESRRGSAQEATRPSINL